MITTTILRLHVNIVDMTEAIIIIKQWLQQAESRYICLGNVHMCMETFDDSEYLMLVNQSDMTVADGKPLVWAAQLLGHAKIGHIRGFDLTMRLCEIAMQQKIRVGFLGASEQVLTALTVNLSKTYPGLNICYAQAPPYTNLDDVDYTPYIDAIKQSDVQLLFVGLGCPKQEMWMARHKNQLDCIMLGVGASFDFIAGNKKSAPIFMQTIGCEWLYRLYSEPKRLWKRYAKHNPRFVFYLIYQLITKHNYTKS